MTEISRAPPFKYISRNVSFSCSLTTPLTTNWASVQVFCCSSRCHSSARADRSRRLYTSHKVFSKRQFVGYEQNFSLTHKKSELTNKLNQNDQQLFVLMFKIATEVSKPLPSCLIINKKEVCYLVYSQQYTFWIQVALFSSFHHKTHIQTGCSLTVFYDIFNSLPSPGLTELIR